MNAPISKPMGELIWSEVYWHDRAEEVLAISADIRNPECKRNQKLVATYDNSRGLPQGPWGIVPLQCV
jgi:hypothetical protein